jgi:stage V sporulation protein G
MQISEVQIRLNGRTGDRLRAYCSITLDNEFVIRDLRVIDGPHGPFVAMPSRRLVASCVRCGQKNHLRARFCNECGTSLPERLVRTDASGREKLYADVAHPTHTDCRKRIEQSILRAYEEELRLAAKPGYVPRCMGDDESDADARASASPVVSADSRSAGVTPSAGLSPARVPRRTC